MSDGVQYTFKVVPYYKYSSTRYESISSKSASVYTLKQLGTPEVYKSTKTSVKVGWTDIEGQSGYQISQSTSKTKTKIVSTYATTSGQSKTIKATKNKKYYYKVRPYKKVGKSKIYGPWSAVKEYTLSDKPDTVEIKITNENVNEYFEVKEFIEWEKDSFGDVCGFNLGYVLCVKDKYVNRLGTSYDGRFIENNSNIAFKYEWDNKEYHPVLDYDKRTYKFVESNIPSYEYESTSETEECTGEFSKMGNYWCAVNGWSYQGMNRDDYYEEDFTLTRHVNIRITRAAGTLILTR